MTDYTDLKARLEALSKSRGKMSGSDILVLAPATDLAEALAAIEALEAERDEAIRRRNAWKAKAEGYDELAAAVRAKVKEEPATMSRILLKAALIDADKQRAALEADVARLRAVGLTAVGHWQSWVDDQLQGTSIYDEELAEVNATRAALTTSG